MFPLEVHDDESVGGRRKSLLVAELFNMDETKEEMAVTIVASVNGIRGGQPDLYEAENIGDWAAYMAAFSADTPKEERIRHCRTRGNKLPEELALVIFPRLQVGRYRR